MLNDYGLDFENLYGRNTIDYTVSKAPNISSDNRDSTCPLCSLQIVRTMHVSSSSAVLVLRPALAPICSERRRFSASAASLILFATTFSITLPIVFKSAIGLHALGVSYELLPTFLMTIVLALLRKGGRCSSLRLAFVS